MIITEIYADGFRNLTGRLACTPGINILCGDNAQGKTNWLEAIYLLGNTKSFRTTVLRETLRFGNERGSQARIRGNIRREGLEKELQLQLEESSKSFYINSKRETVSRYLGNLDVIIFCAEEMQIVRGEPSERRRFLDRGVVGLSPSYLKTLSEYNRVLKQKNILLKEAQESDRRLRYIDLIEAWNEQLIEYGSQIHRARLEYIDRLHAVLGKQLFSERPIEIRYRSCLEQHGLDHSDGIGHYCKLLHERLNVRLESEIAAGYALVGPHRDELEILIDGLEASKFGSSGEQRSALITLDLAQISVYNLAFEEYPVFLIDDIDAELDARRISLLLDHLDGKMQVFISTSKRAIASRYRDRASCQFISQGEVVETLKPQMTLSQRQGLPAEQLEQGDELEDQLFEDQLKEFERTIRLDVDESKTDKYQQLRPVAAGIDEFGSDALVEGFDNTSLVETDLLENSSLALVELAGSKLAATEPAEEKFEIASKARCDNLPEKIAVEDLEEKHRAPF